MKFDKENFSIQDAMRLAETPAGKELISILQSSGGDSMDKAKKAAAQGDYNLVKENLADLMKSPKIQSLLREMGQQNG